MNKSKLKLSLDRPAKYQLKVPGQIPINWADYIENVDIQVGNNAEGVPVTILTGILDQASLQGLLRRLYSLGIPLISVVCIDCE